ncbi:DNA/RNA nuclease SfsA [Kaarinaea lacus]
MRFDETLLEGRLIRRYKRFLADVELADGRMVTAHTANTGAMTGCCDPGSRVWLSVSDNPKRKYAYTWELVEANSGGHTALVGINTLMANHLVAEAITHRKIKALENYDCIRKEVRYGQENSRIDLLLTAKGDKASNPCYVEVKNVTLAQDGVGYFPDAKSVRATKHLRELSQVSSKGAGAVIFFCVPREDVMLVRPARFIDPEYADALHKALENGVQALAYRAKVSAQEIVLQDSLPVKLD